MVAPDIMTPVIDKAKTGRQIKAMMKMRHVTVEDVRAGLSLGCVQSVYHWRGAFAALLQAFAGLYGGLKESDHIIQSNPGTSQNFMRMHRGFFIIDSCL